MHLGRQPPDVAHGKQKDGCGSQALTDKFSNAVLARAKQPFDHKVTNAQFIDVPHIAVYAPLKMQRSIHVSYDQRCEVVCSNALFRLLCILYHMFLRYLAKYSCHWCLAVANSVQHPNRHQF